MYSWFWETGPEQGETLVTVEFHERGGSTEVILTHDRFPNAHVRDRHQQGWTGCLEKLSVVLAAGEARGWMEFPGETPEYRAARERLLEAERDLRRRLARDAALRRTLPLGGALKEDYVFEESGPVRLSKLFAPGKDYHLQYGAVVHAPRSRAGPSARRSDLATLELVRSHTGRPRSRLVSTSDLYRMRRRS